MTANTMTTAMKKFMPNRPINRMIKCLPAATLIMVVALLGVQFVGRIKHRIAAMTAATLIMVVALLGGCAGLNQPGVGPGLSSTFGKSSSAAKLAKTAHLPKIEVLVPVFDPNLPKDSDKWEKKGIYPELRRAESNRFALKMKSALESTGAFGAVRVVPNTEAVGDLYVIGKILKSNGEDVEINLTATDISGKKWFSRDFKHRVKSAFHENPRNTGKDAYDPLFDEAADYIVKRLSKQSAEDLKNLQLTSQLRFGASLSEASFEPYLTVSRGRITPVGAPAANDPTMRRIAPLRVRHQLFIDRLQTHYADFDNRLDDSYLVWQQQSIEEVKGARKSKAAAIAKGIAGGVLLGLGAAVEAEQNTGFDDILVGTAATVGGAVLLGGSFQSRAEMKIHREALAELGRDIDIEIAPQIVEYEAQTAKLTGDAAEQYAQWIAFLQEIYRLEAAPDKQL